MVKINRLLKIFFLSLFLCCCSSELDLTQLDDLNIEPEVVANLASFNIDQNQIIAVGGSTFTKGDSFDFDVFENASTSNKIRRVDLFFEFSNTIDRAFQIEISLLDARNVVIDQISINAPRSTDQYLVTRTEIFENARLNTFKQTRKLQFSVTLLPGSPIVPSGQSELKMRSSGTIYFQLK